MIQDEILEYRKVLTDLLDTVCSDPRWCSCAAHKAARELLERKPSVPLYQIRWNRYNFPGEFRRSTLAGICSTVGMLVNQPDGVTGIVIERDYENGQFAND